MVGVRHHDCARGASRFSLVTAQLLHLPDFLRHYGNASFNREISQADSLECGQPDYYRPSSQTSLRFTLTPQVTEQGDGRTGITLRWQRPAEGGCERPGSRVVELNEAVPIVAGQRATVSGDAGLVVRIRRR